jgi:hypothetical protein
MPLPPPAPRRRLHDRRVRYEGYVRDDGLFDIDASIVDVKDHDCPLLSGIRPAGEPVHDMWVRVTIDRQFAIRAIETSTDAMPYPGGCDDIDAAYRKLVGACLVKNFRQTLQEAVGSVRGCTHITELLAYLPTAAVQTFAGLQIEDDGIHRPFQLDRCHALESSSDVVRRFYPKWYRPRGAHRVAGSDVKGDAK